MTTLYYGTRHPGYGYGYDPPQLHQAVRSGEPGQVVYIAQELHDIRIDLNVLTNGESALHLAARLGNLGVVNALLLKGMNPEFLSALGETAEQIARANGNIKCADLLANSPHRVYSPPQPDFASLAVAAGQASSAAQGAPHDDDASGTEDEDSVVAGASDIEAEPSTAGAASSSTPAPSQPPAKKLKTTNTGKSKYLWVCPAPPSNPSQWRVEIKVKGKIHVPPKRYYDDEIEAARAADELAASLGKEYRNFP